MQRLIGEAAKLSGVGIETIRYYEREGVVSKPARSSRGRRIYSMEEITRLRFVRRCRDLGFSIPDIKSLIDLAETSGATCDEASAIGWKNLYLVREKIVDLKRMEGALKQLIMSCSSGRKDCPMLRELFADR